jgi:hypothetical protein
MIYYVISDTQYLTKSVDLNDLRSRPGRGRMVVGFTTTYAISVYHH